MVTTEVEPEKQEEWWLEVTSPPGSNIKIPSLRNNRWMDFYEPWTDFEEEIQI